MIIVNTNGRMGNQMFQYAFAFSTAKKLNASFLIDEPHHKFCLEQYFKLPSFNHLKNKFARKSIKISGIKNVVFQNKEIFDNSVSPHENLEKLSNNTLYQGYFQSDQYFKDHLELVKKEYEIKENYKSIFLKKFESFFSQYYIIAVHIRRTDYIQDNSERNFLLPLEYYYHSIETIIKDKKDKKIILFFMSDDIEFVKSKFSGMKEKCYFSEEPEIIDFQIIKNANAVIIANSTFSWWAAYLNERADVVHAPLNWLAINPYTEYPNGIMTEKFRWINYFNLKY